MKAETDIENTKLRVQETLDELFCERLIPFRLTACKVNADGSGEYIIPFNDSKMDSIRFSWNNDEPFKEVVRAAIVDGVERTSGSSERLNATKHVGRTLVLSLLAGGVALMFPRILLARVSPQASLATSKVS